MREANVSDRLKARLDELGWSQRDLAREVKTSAAVVCRLVSGERAPSLDLAFRIEKSPVAIPASAWVSHAAADESGEHTAPTAADIARAATSG